MNCRIFKLMVAVMLIFVLSNIAFAQNRDDLKYGVGFQGSFPAYGFSGMMDINENVSAQAILGFFGALKTYAVRGLYRFKKEDYWDLYGYGMLGAWNYGSLGVSETAVGFGFGAGLEYDWRKWGPDLPPLFWNLELGIGIVNFDKVNYDFSALLIGVGVHYRF